MTIYDTREGARLATNRQRTKRWARWGPYLAERAWGTVREDYSADGEAWGYFPHDHEQLGFRSRDGPRRLAGLPDTEEPDEVEAVGGEPVEVRIGDVIERRRAPEPAGQLREPDRAC